MPEAAVLLILTTSTLQNPFNERKTVKNLANYIKIRGEHVNTDMGWLHLIIREELWWLWTPRTQKLWICVRYTDSGVESDTKIRRGARGGHYFFLDGTVSYGSEAPKWAAHWTGANELEAAEWLGIAVEEGWEVPKEIRIHNEGENSSNKQRSQRGQLLNFECDYRWEKSKESNRKRRTV